MVVLIAPTNDLRERMAKQYDISIKKEIGSNIKKRLLTAFFALLILVVTMSLLEFLKEIHRLEKRLNQQANDLSDAIISEILVNNRDSISSRLQDIQIKEGFKTVVWEKSVSHHHKSKLEFILPFTWKFTHPIQSFGSLQEPGNITFTGDVSNNIELLKPISFQIFLLALFCLVVGLIFIPLATKIPDRFILHPINKLVDTIRGDLPYSYLDILATYVEIRPAIQTLKDYFNNKETIDRQKHEFEKNRIIAEFSQMLAHDICRPFSLLESGLESLKGSTTPEYFENSRNMLIKQVSKAKHKAECLVSDILTFGTTDNCQPTRLNPQDLIQDAIDEISIQRQQKDISINIDLKHTSMVKASDTKTVRVLTNIIQNALDASTHGGSLWIRTQNTTESEIEFCIRNSGSYIPKEDRDLIFTPQYTSGKPNGKGWGLAIAKKYVQEQGGSISCQSNLEFGTEFIFTLPADFTRNHQTPVGKSKPLTNIYFPKLLNAKHLSIALLEDDPIFAHHWMTKHSKLDFKHFECPNKFFQILTEEPHFIREIDLVITDYFFDDSSLSGKDIGYRIKSMNSSIPVFLSTGLPLKYDSGEWCDCVIGKDPLEITQIYSLLQKTVYRHSQNQNRAIAHHSRSQSTLWT
jgi:signal transduction histidine kinase